MHNPFRKNRASRLELPTGEVAITIVNGQPLFQIEPMERWRDQSKVRVTVPTRWAHGLMALFVAFLAFPVHAQGYTANDIISKTNAARQSEGVPVLHTNQKLMQAAAAKGNDMLAKGYFSHTSPGGQTPWSWITGAGYAYTEAGENLAKDYVDADGVIAGWLGSSTHRKNLLNTKFRDIGVAVIDGTMNGQSTILVVQFFGSQKATPTAAPVTPNPAPTPKPTPAPVQTDPVSQPTPPPAPTPTPVPQPVVVEPRINSLVHPDGLPVPTLTFTLQEPDPSLRQPRPLEPKVEGVQTGFQRTQASTVPSTLQRDLPLLMLVAFLAELLALAGYGLLQARLPKKLSLEQLGFQIQSIRA